MSAPFGSVTLGAALLVLIGFDAIAFLSIRGLLRRTFA
jgi:ABC-2 type transport system permease protein